jgi:PAS domain S-box-containing protein
MEAALLLDPESETILEVNPSACRLLGYEHGELIGLSALVIHPHDYAQFRHFAERVLERGRATTEELSCRARDGSLVPVEVLGVRIEVHGRPAILKLVRSIQLRRQIETALSESEERLQRVLDSTLDAIVTFDLESRAIQLFNRSAERLFACAASQGVGSAIDRYLAPALLDRIREGEAGDAASTSWLPDGFRVRRADGREVTVEASISLVRVRDRHFCTLVLRDVEELRRAQLEALVLRAELERERRFTEIVGDSPPIRRILQHIETVAPTDSTVLILGETGTGKELVARAIHRCSPLAQAPLIAVNCAALPANLIESELFGHEKGAFTGAHCRKLGRFELADDGTLFLDEVGDLPLELQAKLLRVLQTGEIERVGGTKTIKVRARVIAATNRDLERAAANGSFRADLYFRLAVYPIVLPALRERTEDIPLLVQHLVEKHASRLGKRVGSIPPEALSALASYPWPGNVRELENIVERAVIIGSHDGRLQLRAPSGSVGDPVASAPAARSFLTLEEMQRCHIRAALEQTGGQVSGASGAARLLGLKPTTLESRMKRLGIRHRGRRGRPPKDSI